MTEGKGLRDAKRGPKVPQCGRKISRPGKGNRDAQTASGICGIAEPKKQETFRLSREFVPRVPASSREFREFREFDSNRIGRFFLLAALLSTGSRTVTESCRAAPFQGWSVIPPSRRECAALPALGVTVEPRKATGGRSEATYLT